MFYQSNQSIVKIIAGPLSSPILLLQVEGSLGKSPRELYGSSGNKKSTRQKERS